MLRSSEKGEIRRESVPKSSKPSSAGGCKPNVHPQQTTFEFENLTLDSCFDSGNMSSAVEIDDTHYHIWIAPDCSGSSKETDHRTWFYFRAKDLKKTTTYTFTIKNMNFQAKLFSEGLVPVYKSNAGYHTWRRVDEAGVSIQKYDKGIEVTFRHTFDSHDHEVYFAFTYPWSYTEDQVMIEQYEQEYKNDPQIYFNRELLVYSREQRRIELLTITSHSKKLDRREQTLPNLFPEGNGESRPFMYINRTTTFSPNFNRFDKKYVFISARVHPGETPGSYMMNGLLKFLLSRTDLRAQALRDNFVMVLVPILNPDGVYRGHYRNDTHGLNLNRYYINPTLVEHPSIYATKQIILGLSNTQRLFLYCDLHAHATKRGCFVYGNRLDFQEQIDAMLFPKLLSLNSQYFDYDACDFSEKNVHIKDKGDGKNKEGAGRVALYKATNLVRCYTLEFNYNSGKQKNVLSNARVHDHGLRHEESKVSLDANDLATLDHEKLAFQGSYMIEHFEEVGEGIGPTLLDMIKANPMSRVTSSVFKSLQNLKISLALKLMKDPPFRFDVYLRKMSKNITQNMHTLLNYINENVKGELREEKKETVEEKPVKRSVTLPPNKRRNYREPKDTIETKESKELKVVNIVVHSNPVEVKKQQRPQVKMIIRKKMKVSTNVSIKAVPHGAKKILEAL